MFHLAPAAAGKLLFLVTRVRNDVTLFDCDYVQLTTLRDKELRCRRAAARCFVSLNSLLSCYSRLVKVIENVTIRKLWFSFLFVFHSNYGRIFSRFDTMHERDRHPVRQTSPHDGIGRAYV